MRILIRMLLILIKEFGCIQFQILFRSITPMHTNQQVAHNRLFDMKVTVFLINCKYHFAVQILVLIYK